MFKNPILKNLLRISIPVILGELSFSILSIIDKFFISRLGLVQSAGASLSGSLIWLIINMAMFIIGGSIAIVSRRIGEKNILGATKVIAQSLNMALLVGVTIGILSWYLAHDFFTFYNVQPSVLQNGVQYFQYLAIGFPFMITSLTISACFQAAGQPKIPMYIFIVMSTLNISLDAILIFIFEWGIKGAALATVISEIIAFLLLLHFLLKNKKFSFSISSFFPDFSVLKKIANIGFWSGLNSLSRPLSAIFLQKIVAYHGTNAIAAFGFGMQWVSLFFIFFEGLKIAVASQVGKYLGSQEHNKVVTVCREAFKFGLLIVIVSTCGVFYYAKAGIAFFSLSPDVIQMGADYLRIIMIGSIFSVMISVFAAALNGSGYTMPPMLISFIANWLGKIGFAALTTYYLNWSVTYIWIAILISMIMEGLGNAWWFKYHRKVIVL